MFQLIGKELKYQFKSITFYVFFFIVFLFFISQFLSESDFKKPVGGQKSYGLIEETNPELIMQKVYGDLYRDLEDGTIVKYPPPFHIYKQVKLSPSQKSTLEKILLKMSPRGEQYPKGKLQLSYDQFMDLVHQLDKAFGGHTVYNDENRNIFRPMTYEEALNKYNELSEKDKITNAFGRLFADYMGITAGLFSIFIAAFVLLRDRQKNAHEMIYSSQVSPCKYVAGKYFGVVIAIMVCYLTMATIATIGFIQLSIVNHYPIDYFAFYKYTITWIMPTVLFVVAFGMFFSILFHHGIVPIVLQFILWLNGMTPLEGSYSLNHYYIRFNHVGGYNNYIQWQSMIITNRIFYTCLALILLLLTIYIWSKRRGHIINLSFNSIKECS